MSVPSLSSVQLFSAMKNSRAYGIDKGKGGKSFIYCRVKTQLSTYSSLREPRSSPFVYAKINSLIYGQRTKQGSARDTNHTRCCLSHMEMEPCYHKDKRKCLFEWSQKILKVLSFQSQKWIECHVRAFPFSLFSSRFCSYFSLFSTESLNGMIDHWHEPKRGKWNLKLQRREAALKIITAGGPCQFIFIFSAVLYSQIFLKFPLKYHLVLF